MRFHHSTRRGRTKFSQGGGPHHRAGGGGGRAAGHSAVSNRWAQLSYCRQTNIHFHRRLPVEVPASARTAGAGQAAGEAAGQLEQRMGQLRVAPSGGGQTADLAPPSAMEAPATTPPSKLAARRAARASSKQKQQQQRARQDQTKPQASQMIDQNNNNENENNENNENTNEDAKDNHHQAEPANLSAKLDMEGARERLIAQVEKHPFWSNKAAKRMRLLDLLERRIFIYELVSHCERRDLEWRYEPYRGGAAVGARRALSSAGARPATSPPLAVESELDSGGADQGQLHQRPPSSVETPLKRRLHSASSMSQPASPLNAPAAPIAPSSPTRPQFAFEQLQAPQGELGAQQAAAALRRQTIRRSCSSAVTSPSRSPPSQLASQSTLGLAAADGAPLSWGEPRPLPSAELVWSIEPPARLRPAPFASYIHTTEVPDSAFVKRCHGCQGRGRLKCTSCYGVGYEVCISCSGKGTMKSLASAPGHTGGAHQARAAGAGRDANSSHGATVGGMWGNAEAGESRLGGSSRRDEPGGISGGASGGGSGGASAWTTECCHFCHGAGQKRCWICAGRAYNTCTACAGVGQLRCFLNLNITWTNHRDECVLNNADAIIPRDRLRLSSGLLLADEIADRLAPLARHGGVTAPASSATPPPPPPRDGAPVEGAPVRRQSAGSPPDTPARGRQPLLPLEQVVRASELSQLQAFSARLLEKHANQYERSERLLRQRQRVTQIECHLVNWEWKRRRGHFVIYGDERKVYIAKYPFKSICNIT